MPTSLGRGGRRAAGAAGKAEVRTTVMMQSKMSRQMRVAMVEDGYGLRGKSRWVGEAVQRFLTLDEAHWTGLVVESDVGASLTDREMLSLTAADKRELDRACISLRASEPMLDGPMSAIVRTAVLWRLMDEPLEELRVRLSNSTPTD